MALAARRSRMKTAIIYIKALQKESEERTQALDAKNEECKGLRRKLHRDEEAIKRERIGSNFENK